MAEQISSTKVPAPIRFEVIEPRDLSMANMTDMYTSIIGQTYVQVPNSPNIPLCSASQRLSPSIIATQNRNTATAIRAIAAF